MAETPKQGELFDSAAAGSTTVAVNARCLLRTEQGLRVVFVAGLPMAHFAVGDRMAAAYAMVTMVERGWADQKEVARAFACSARTVRRTQRRFEQGGLAALGRGAGYPRGRARLREARSRRVHDLKAQGHSNRAIGALLGVTEKAVRKLLRRLGWKPADPAQRELPLGPAAARERADPNVSASATPPSPTSLQGPEKSTATPVATAPSRPRAPSAGADPNLSASVSDPPASTDATEEPLPITFDTDPANRQQDRLYAHLGLLADAMPMFREGTRIPRAGVLLAMPALLDTGVLDCARDIYGSIGPAFYGLRTSIVAMLVMALLRIKRPEALKEQSPADLGRLLGLDRAPEVKTLRRKLSRLAASGRATDFGRALATRRVAARGQALGFLYVDGHLRVYHGKRSLPKAHVPQRHLPMPATTDYWINDALGDPLFVVTAEANAGLVKMLPPVLDEMRKLVGPRRVTIVFDRGGFSPRLFQTIVASGFDILTYRKGRFRRVSKTRFHTRRATLGGRKVSYVLADQRVRLLQGHFELRQVTRLSGDGHQTPILTSRTDLRDIEVAFRMFERWRQENFFKYLSEEYALDALVDYGVEPDDAAREVPNPRWNAIDAELRRAREFVRHVFALYGVDAAANQESVRRTMRGFKIANASGHRAILDALKRHTQIEAKRARVPKRVPVQQVVEGTVIKLAAERKHLTSLIKMVAYQAESDLVRAITPHYKRADDEARTLIQTALASPADLAVVDDELRVTLAPLSSAHRTTAVRALCDEINRRTTRFPGTALRLRFAVAPPPDGWA